jgi:TonB-linked SusC/RagA family outer membrane protein
VDKSHQIVLNNYAAIDVPFIPGLNYRLNVGFRFRFLDKGYYAGRDTKEGLEARGRASTDRNQFNSTVIENVLSYSRTFGLHNIFATGVFSFEGNKTSSNSMSASGFPHDFLTWYSSSQAELIVPAYSYNENYLISQMLRFNYSYGSRYLVTLTSRRDGYSGFGTKHKWGIFPSFALGWNISNESFFPWKNIINELKLRASIGYNGNQAVSAYESISRLSQFNMVSNKTTVPGYRPSKLGQDELGWESSRSINLGLDFGIYKNRISGEINIYNTNTTDLLLDRSISAVHGITSITQNIGETRNIGLEVSLNSRNIIKNDFSWTTSGNLALLKNKIVSLYGTLDEKGKEIDDVANEWFIGYPIRVNFDYVWLGTWQLEEAEEAASWGSQPGFVKLWDADGDKTLTAADRRIIGQRDPKFLWGLNNSFTYKNFGLDIFVHGIHGVTKRNTLMADATFAETRQSTTKKDWWTPTNPTNKWVMNHYDATRMGGITAAYYEKADFLRLKDLSFSYNFSKNVLEKLKITNLRAFITGRNLLTLTKWSGLDPELDSQTSTPLQREFVIGLNTSF